MRFDALILAACAYLVGLLTFGTFDLPDTLGGTLQRLWLLLLMLLFFGGLGVFLHSLKPDEEAQS